jgi:hypothetical protein
MGAKGDRPSKEPLAQRLYADGMCLTDISRQLDISDTTLRRWKEESLVPGQEIDGWEKARQQKRGNITRLKDLFERQLEYVESLNPMEVTAAMMDTLSKASAMVERWDKAEAVVRKLATLEKGISENDKTVPVEAIRRIREEVFGL